GNLRTALLCASLARKLDAFARVLIGTDTPTGSGIMPLGMLYTIAHLASLGGIAPELAIAAATGSNARVYRLDCGLLAAGRAAEQREVVAADARLGGIGDAARQREQLVAQALGFRGQPYLRAALVVAAAHPANEARSLHAAQRDHRRRLHGADPGGQLALGEA